MDNNVYHINGKTYGVRYRFRGEDIPFDLLAIEYEQVEKKISKLSRSQRDYIENVFKAYFEEVEQITTE